jgi:hypothetical protein
MIANTPKMAEAPKGRNPGPGERKSPKPSRQDSSHTKMEKAKKQYKPTLSRVLTSC